MRTVCLVLLLLFMGNITSAATDSDFREVSVGLYLRDITKINEIDNTFTAELDVFVSWKDPALGFDSQEEGSDTRVFSGPQVKEYRSGSWAAQILPTNPIGNFKSGGEKMVVFADGQVELTGKVGVTLRARLDYRDFPFDTQVLPLELESFPWNRNQVRLVVDQEHTGFDQLFALAEWQVMGMEVDQYETLRVRDVVPFSNLVFNVSVKRDSGFYLLKIFLTVLIIVSLTWVVFWMSGEGLGRRAGISSSGILTVIAYQFVTTSTLPKVSYLTVADKVMILSVVIIAATMVESVIVDSLTHTDLPRKLKIDRFCRVAFPAFYLSALLALAIQTGLFV